MPLYESTFILRQDLPTTEVDRIIDEFADIVKKGGGKVKQREYWGLKSLSYRINKSKKGHYVFLGLDSPVKAVQDMEQKVRYTEDVVRNLTVRVEKLVEGATAMMSKEKEYEAA
jgi:small subunit ribosomal protein S6